ncbi:MAG: hypothetical protein PHV85_06675 [Desulfovibrionaceae bacterium]|nr:hypothetical protein [Desulfovibrionaceae bacterium]
MSLRKFACALILSALALAPVLACGQEPGGLDLSGYRQAVDNGVVDWGTGEVSATRPAPVAKSGLDPLRDQSMAVRRAAVEARKDLLVILRSMRIDSATTVGRVLDADPALDSRVRAFLQNSMISREDDGDRDLEVTVAVSLRGQLSGIVLPLTAPFLSGISPRLSPDCADPESCPAPARPALPDSGSGKAALEGFGSAALPGPASLASLGAYTGLVVDARGLGAVPALLPVIYGQNGQAAYGPFLVSRASAEAYGLAAYAASPDAALVLARAGDRPLRVKAVRLAGGDGVDLVISAPDAAAARNLFKAGDAARKCSVALVID